MNATHPAADRPSVTLDQLAPGATCTVVGVSGHGAVRRRLLEMGLCSGVAIEVLRRAPLGDPIELRVRGYLLSLRRDQAALVAVSTLALPSAPRAA